MRDARIAAKAKMREHHEKAKALELKGEDASTAQAEFEASKAEADKYDAMIAREEAVLDDQRDAPSANGNGHDVQVTVDASAHPFSNIGEFLGAAKEFAVSKGRTADQRLFASQGQNETNPDDGGFLVPVEFSSTIFKRVFGAGTMASRCFQIPMSSARFVWPALRDDDRRDGKRFGGVTGYWTAEGKPIAKAKVKTREQQLVAHKLAVIVALTDEQLEDGPAVQAIVDQAVPEEFDYLLDSSIYAGDGQGKPAGAAAVATNPSLVVVPKTAGQAAATISWQNLIDMWARMPAGLKQDAAWFVTEDMESVLDGLLLNTENLNPMFLPYQAANTPGNPGPYAKFKGAPIIPIEQAPAIGTQGDIFLAAMSQYALGRRGGLRTEQSMHVYFETDEQAFKWTTRVDGESMWDKPVTPASSALKKSPFVVLQAR